MAQYLSGYRLLEAQRARGRVALSYVLSTPNLGRWIKPE